MDVVEPTEKHLEGTAIKKTNDVVNVADIERDYPVPVKYYEYGTNSEPLTHANNFIRDWPLPIDFPSTTQTPDRLFPNPDYNVPKVIGSTDRVMVLEPRKDFSSCDANDVKSKLQNVWLKKWTENYVYSLKKKNEHMPIVDSDNMLWSKFSRAVIENFLLTFYRTYLQDISLSEWSLAEFLDVNAYNNSFYTALKHLRDRKGQTALEFAAEPRRHSDICKAIIAKPIDIVQSHCTTNMPTWVCNVKYLAELTDESKSCSSIWIHALIHLKTIEVNARIDPGDIIVDELEATIYTQPSSDANLLFDFIIDTIESLRIPLKEPLKTNTKLYRDIKDYEEKDLLRCLEID
ncbi:uncharacterized protein [Epargyreus clarus]|uniref:uncharacterized protein n=1 Tax=Epargyreus clarus TaxID=520877 RepID=UPI003C2C8065